MDEIKETGGARIGNGNATWPFAKLIVNKDELQLNAGIIGNLVFCPADIMFIEPYTPVPFLGQGIRIIHNVNNYNNDVIFWTFANPVELIERIKQTGFLNNTAPPLTNDITTHIRSVQSSGSFPIKKPAAFTIILIWNLFFLIDLTKIFKHSQGAVVGFGAQLGLGFLFLTTLAALLIEPFRDLILKPGRTLNDIKTSAWFILFITGVMFVFLTFLQ
ncbi:hypothetical protein [Mucilaginibacter sp.]|uniref:hypothetical protein n=1 Tax=Mucilaginibacter sp. TaxID=1882438 RepID=UPI003D13ECFC